MDLSQVKQVFCKQGEVKRILEGDVVLWEKKGHFSGKVVLIPSDSTEPITDFTVGRYAEIMFKADAVPEWSISELPAGLVSEVTSEGLKIAGYATEAGSKDVEISTGSDTQTYTFRIDDDGEVEYGIRITTSNEYPVTDFELNKFASKTFEASFYVPEEEQDSPVEWSFTNLPSGLSASGATVSGTATDKGIITVNVVVKKGSYSCNKGYKFRRYGIEVYGNAMSKTSLPSGKQGTSYSATLHISKFLPSETTGNLLYYASNLPAGLSLNNSTGVISGTPTAWGNNAVSVYATLSQYTSPTRILNLTIEATPVFTAPDSVAYLDASMSRDNYFLGYIVGTHIINGSGFSLSGMQFVILGGNSVIVKGDQTANVPIVDVSISVIDDHQLKLDFVLTKRSQADAAALRKRGLTMIKIYMFTGGNGNPSGIGAKVYGMHTLGIGFK